MNILSENWFAVAVAVYLLAMMLYGHHKGFIRLAVSMAALVASLIVVNFAMPKVTTYVREHTSVGQIVKENMRKMTGLSVDGSGLVEIPADQRMLIEQMNLPSQIKDTLIENNNNEVYQVLGVNAFVDYITTYLSNMVINTIGFALMFLIVYISFRLLMRWLDIIAKLPILSGINKIAGAALGIAEGLVFFWIFSLFITVFSGNGFSEAVLSQIESVPWLMFLYSNNIFSKIVLGIVATFV